MSINCFSRLVKNKAEYLKAVFGFIASICFVYTLSCHVQILTSETDSIAQHYFLHFPKIKPGINDYTVLWSDWYQGKIIKKIIGVANDEIITDKNGQIVVNDFKVGNPLLISSSGKALTAIKAKTIPEGFVFLYSSHPRSFDSRYQELGLVPLSSLQGLVVPLG